MAAVLHHSEGKADSRWVRLALSTWLRYARYNQGRNVCFNVLFNNNNSNNGHFYSAVSPDMGERTLIYKINKNAFIKNLKNQMYCSHARAGTTKPTTQPLLNTHRSPLIAHCSGQSRGRPKPINQPLLTALYSLLTAHCPTGRRQ